MWFTALILGFAGSLHCAGMCSPLAMAATMRGHVLLNRFLYNAGRIFTYGLLGTIMSTTGMGLSASGFQNQLSIILGILLLIIGVTGISTIHLPGITPGLQKIASALKSAFADYLARKTYFATMVLGVLNGLLPCGLTFLALTYCLTVSPLNGFIFMLLFGAGTLPAMFGLAFLLSGIMKRFQWSMRRVTTVLLIISGCLLIARVFFIHPAHAPHETKEIVTCG
jgi:sulfite exporter TauE/SafE